MLAGGAGAQASNGLVAEYHFDGDANDSSGGGNHGTINGALFVTGVSEQALSFDGVDDYVEISKLGDPGISDWTLGSWIKLPSGGTGVNPIIAKRNTENDLSLTLRTSPDGDKAECFIDGSYFGYGNQSAKSINDGNWHYLVCTRNGNNINLYVDGIVDNGLVLNYNPYGRAIPSNITSTSKWHIGHQGAWGLTTNGLIDEVRIYNRALSSDEIKAEYTKYIPTISISTDKTIYTPGETVLLNLSISNPTASAYPSHLALHIIWPTGAGMNLLSKSFTMPPGFKAAKTISYPIPSSIFVPSGDYKFNATLTYGSNATSSEAAFTIKRR